MTSHQTAVQWLAENWLWFFVAFWVFGGSVIETGRRAAKRRRKAAALRHRRRVEIALARQGVRWSGKGKSRDYIGNSGLPAAGLPAAVIPTPPGAQPVRGVPGPCRHERIIPVIGADGELKRWVCANYPRCDAEFEPDVAIYEPEWPLTVARRFPEPEDGKEGSP